jgi:hypothetical protein
MSSPSTRTVPDVARSSPAITAISELLPEPEAPSTATVSPSSMDRLIPRRISVRAAPWPRVRLDVVELDQGLGHRRAARKVEGSGNGLDGGDAPLVSVSRLGRRPSGAAQAPSSKSDGPLILAFGDSLTAGYGLGRGLGFAPQLAGCAAPPRHQGAGA